MSGMVNQYQNEKHTNFWGVDFWVVSLLAVDVCCCKATPVRGHRQWGTEQ